MIQKDKISANEKRKDYTIFIPLINPIHFELIKHMFGHSCYHIKTLNSVNCEIVQKESKEVNDDFASFIVKQGIGMLKSDCYDVHKTAILLVQSDIFQMNSYIDLWCKELKKEGLECIPVLSPNLFELTKIPELKIRFNLLQKLLACFVYGDVFVNLSNQIKPYELQAEETQLTIEKWIQLLANQFACNKGYKNSHIKTNLWMIVETFKQILVKKRNRIKVGIVGESHHHKNKLEGLLIGQEWEIKISGLMESVFYCIDKSIKENKGKGNRKLMWFSQFTSWRMINLEKEIVKITKKYSIFDVPIQFEKQQKINSMLSQEKNHLIHEIVKFSYWDIKKIIFFRSFLSLNNESVLDQLKKIDPEIKIIDVDYNSIDINQIQELLSDMHKNSQEKLQ